MKSLPVAAIQKEARSQKPEVRREFSNQYPEETKVSFHTRL